MSDYAGRIAKLQEKMRAEKIALTFLGATDQMRYLTGWAEHGHERLVGLFVPPQGEPAFLVPTMNARQALTNPAGLKTVIGWDDAEGWHDAARSLLAGWGIESGTTLIDDELLSVHTLSLQKLFPGLNCVAGGEPLARIREIKSEDELIALDAAALLIDEIVEEAIGALQEGMTESELADFISSAYRKHNTRPSFNSLICFGENGAHPHHHTGQTRLKRGDVVIIDIGCMWDGYPSDITRTVAFGEPSDPEAGKIYEIVSRAHWAARDAARPGVSGEEVDAAARRVIEEAGYGEYFIHRTGHGIGLSTHEPPNIVKGNTAPLQPRMCFSVEPGIYLSGRFGVRIENIVTMTEKGVRSFNSEAPRALRIV